MHIFELVMRIVYFYPMKALSVMGHSYQLHWTRNTLSFLCKFLGHWTRWNPLYDPELTVINTQFDTVKVRIYQPKERESDGAMIFIHGGGFVLLDVDTYDGVTRELAKKSKMVTISIDYRLAPEHLFPAGIEDCVRAAAFFLREGHKGYGVDPTKVAVVGDSAGGNLAAVVARRLRGMADVPALKLQLLIYPVMQFVDFLTPSYQLYYQEYAGTSLLDPESIARWLMMYIGVDPTPEHLDMVLKNNHTTAEARQAQQFDYVRHEHLPAAFLNGAMYKSSPSLYGNHQLYQKLEPFLLNPDFSPLMASDLSNLPKAMIITMQYDILRDDGVWYAKRLREQGVDVTWKHYDGGFHGLIQFHTEVELASTVLSDVIRFVRENLV